MSYRSFLILMVAATVASLGGWMYILLNVNPDEAGIVGFILFYVTLFAACVGLLSLFGIVIRVHLRKRQATAFREVRIAFRHALWLSLVAVICLALSAQGWLNIWWFLVLLAIVGSLEYAALLIQESRRS
jgi:hypothetical protein